MPDALAYGIKENGISPEDYLQLREAVGFFKHSLEMAQASLKGSLYVVHIETGGRTVGMARVLGDGAQVFVIQDVIVLPEHQGKGLGRTLMERVMHYIKTNAVYPGRAMVLLFAFKGKEGFYRKFGFFTRPNETMGPGMMHFCFID